MADLPLATVNFEPCFRIHCLLHCFETIIIESKKSFFDGIFDLTVDSNK